MPKILFSIGDFFVSFWNFISGLTTEELALYSLIISVIIYFLTKHSEIKMRKHESRKEQYQSFVQLIKQIYENTKGKKTTPKQFEEQARKVMFDAGAAFTIYGSNKLYKEFQFFRMITTDKSIQDLNFFDEHLVLYSLGKMLKTIRKEVGLNRDNTDVPTMLNFIINETYKTDMKINFLKSAYSRIRIKHLLFTNKLFGIIWVKWIYYIVVKPFFIIFYLTIFTLIKRLIVNPIIFIIKLITKIFKKKSTNAIP